MKIYILFVLAIINATYFYSLIIAGKKIPYRKFAVFMALAFLLALVFQVYLCIFK